MSKEKLVFSYLELRRAIGILGILMPFIISIGGWLIFGLGIQNSISSYYYTGMRDVMVGTFFVIGFFLLSYRGHEKKEDIAGNLACVCAVGIAIFPVKPQQEAVSQIIAFVDFLHVAFSAGFFLTLVYFCLNIFTRTDGKPLTQKKTYRNRIYIVCGFIMLFCISGIFLKVFMIPEANLLGANTVFWLETFAIIAFGISWFVKGRAIGLLNDFDV